MKWNLKQTEESIIKMEHCKISKLLNDSSVSKFVTKKWVEVNDLSSGQYSTSQNIRFKNSMLRSNLCDYSDAYAVVNDANRVNKKLTFKNNVPFRTSIWKINNTFLDKRKILILFC